MWMLSIKKKNEIQIIHNLKCTDFKLRIIHVGPNFCVHLNVNKNIMRL